jgi:hypothetical protein
MMHGAHNVKKFINFLGRTKNNPL